MFMCWQQAIAIAMDCVYEIEIKVPFSPISASAGIHEMEGSLGRLFFLVDTSFFSYFFLKLLTNLIILCATFYFL